MNSSTKELYKKLYARGYNIFWLSGEDQSGLDHYLTVVASDNHYVEIECKKIVLRESGFDTFVKSKSYESFDELLQKLDEFNAKRDITHILKEYCTVLRNLSYCPNLQEGIMKDLENLCEKYTTLAKNEKKR